MSLGERETPARVLVVDIGGLFERAQVHFGERLHIAKVASLTDGMREAARFNPRVIVLALGHASADETEVVRILSGQAPALLVITEPSDEERITRLVKAGARGYLDLSEVPARLSAAIRELLRGGIPMSPAAAQVILRRARRSSTRMPAVRVESTPPESALSERQREVLALLARGHSYEHIALALDVSVNTVRSHLRVIYERLGASTKVEAVVIAQQLGLLGAS